MVYFSSKLKYTYVCVILWCEEKILFYFEIDLLKSKTILPSSKKNDLSGRLKSDCLIFSGNNCGTFVYSFI